jgi:hypothetical protein
VNKKQKKMLVWIIVWAGLLIVVLYSPIGSPDLYTNTNYYVVDQPVSVQKGKTLNSPKRNFESENNTNGAELPDISSAPGSNYSAGNYQSSNIRAQGSTYNSQTQSYQNNYSAGSGNSATSGSSFLSGGGSHRSTGSSGITMNNGTSTLSSTSNLSNTGPTKESVNTYTTGTGGTDPGGDPTGDPIPVGDGWETFILLGLLYFFTKIFKTTNKHKFELNN